MAAPKKIPLGPARRTIKKMDCPYHERIQDPSAKRFVAGYCHGYPAGRPMVPSLMEERRYCRSAGGYLRCPIYSSKLIPIRRLDPTGAEDADAGKKNLYRTSL